MATKKLIWIPEDLHEMLRELAFLKRTSIAAEAETSLRDALVKNSATQPGGAGRNGQAGKERTAVQP
jgi:hypothetical protein